MRRPPRPDAHPGSVPGVPRLSASAETSPNSVQRGRMSARLTAGHRSPAQRREQCLAYRHKCRLMRHFHGADRIGERLRGSHSLLTRGYSSGPSVCCRRRPNGRQDARASPYTRFPWRLPAPRNHFLRWRPWSREQIAYAPHPALPVLPPALNPCRNSLGRLPHHAAGISYMPIHGSARMSLISCDQSTSIGLPRRRFERDPASKSCTTAPCAAGSRTLC